MEESVAKAAHQDAAEHRAHPADISFKAAKSYHENIPERE